LRTLEIAVKVWFRSILNPVTATGTLDFEPPELFFWTVLVLPLNFLSFTIHFGDALSLFHFISPVTTTFGSYTT
jgi:hypothetical protein